MSDDARPGTVIVVASDAMRGARVEAALRELTGWRRIVCTPARLRALSDELCRQRWRAKLGTTDLVLVDRPGRGYGDDYTPWLLDAEVGRLVAARAVGLSEEGILAVAA